ncbi:MAG: prepilin peptidase [Pseudomonadota bacterium]
MEPFSAWATVLGLLAAAVTDLRFRVIPNLLVAALLLIFAIAVLFGDATADVLGALLGAGSVFVAGAVLFAFGAMGGGDVKLMSATALWAAPDRLLEYLLVTTLAGGALAIVVLVMHRARMAIAGGVSGSMSIATVPYGVAIAAGGIWILSDRL